MEITITIIDGGLRSKAQNKWEPLLSKRDWEWNADTGALTAQNSSTHGANAAGIAALNSPTDTRIAIIRAYSGGICTSLAARGIRYAGERGARVVSLSARMAHLSTIYDAAKEFAEKYNGLVICGGGNYGGTAYNGTKKPGVLAVAALDSDGKPLKSAEQGTLIFASAIAATPTCSSTGVDTVASAACSFAIPMVAAAVAQIMTARPDLGYASVAQVLWDSCDPVLSDPGKVLCGGGRVNIAKAVELALAQ